MMKSCWRSGTILVILILIPASRSDEETLDQDINPSDNETQAIDSTSGTSSVPTTTNLPKTTLRKISNSGIFGCTWPDDFHTRFKFCFEKAGLELPKTESIEDQIQHGVMDRAIIRNLSNSCGPNSLDKCVHPIKEELLDSFVKVWAQSTENYQTLETCLRENTEALNRLCESTSEVGKVVSGAAGLHLNLLITLIRVRKIPGTNVTQKCLRKVAEATHITAAMYIQSQHYMDNSILCWDLSSSSCSQECKAYASELNCLHSACPEIRPQILQEFGIWQWYFKNSNLAKESCALDDSACIVEEESISHSGGSGPGSLFDMDKFKQKLTEVETSLEKTFKLPFTVIAAISVATILAFIASITLLCLFMHGFCGKKKRNLRYSRLDHGEEAKSLTRGDMDDIE